MGDAKKRLTAKAALKHPWFEKFVEATQSSQEQVSMSPEVIQHLREFRGQSKLKKASLNILVKMINPNDLIELRQEFEKIDTDHSGLIEFKELEKALKNSNIKLNYEEID